MRLHLRLFCCSVLVLAILPQTSFADILDREQVHVTVLASSQEKRVFQAWQGEIDLEKLEVVLSELLAAPVEIHSMRWPMNPSKYGTYMLSKFMSGGENIYATYVIHYRLDEKHEVSCNFVLIINQNKAMMNNCSSETAAIGTLGFIDFEDFGLPVSQPSKQQYP